MTAAAVLLVCGSLVGRGNSDEAELDRAGAALTAFEAAESGLHRDVLSARAGLLRDYDPMVREIATLHAQLDRLRVTGIAGQAADRLAILLDRQELLTEQFKSDNALLQNALAYFGLFCARLEQPDAPSTLMPGVSRVAAAMLQLTLDTSPQAAAALQGRLDELAVDADRAGQTESYQSLLSYGHMLQTLLPETDDVVRAIFRLSQAREMDAVSRTIQARREMARLQARRHRMVLYGIALLLLVLLIVLVLQLRRRALAQERRTAFDRLIATISMRFIRGQPQEIERNVEQALAELAGWAGADRAYLMLSSEAPRIHAWTGAGTGSATNWPDLAPELMERCGAMPVGIVQVRRADRLPDAGRREVLLRAGVRSWIGVSGLGRDGTTCLLGFDAVRARTRGRAGRAMSRIDLAELGVLRIALDALSNALGRDLLERDRTKLQARVQQARRMETIAALTSGVAHNFNNIIGAILGYAEMAEAAAGSDGPLGQSLAGILRAGERARDLVEQIMQFGRRRDPYPQPVRLHALLEETRSQLEVSLPPGIRLAFADASRDVVLSGEAAQLQQVVVNLCNNAAQAMAGRGTVEVSFSLIELAQERPLRLGRLTPGSWVRIAVHDSGQGIDPAALERIFEPFFTTRRAGNGLGLATVREIVQEHGGALDVTSTQGRGSSFAVWLPRAQATEAGASEPPSSLPLGHGETVMVVHDDPERLLRDEEVVAALGYEPVGFTRADDALAACRRTPTRFDALLLVHVQAPAPLELAKVLHQAVPGLPLVLATGSLDELSPKALRDAGVSGTINRPIGSVELAAILASQLRVAAL